MQDNTVEFLVGALPIRIRKDCQTISLFTTISTLDTQEKISFDKLLGKNFSTMGRAAKIIS